MLDIAMRYTFSFWTILGTMRTSDIVHIGSLFYGNMDVLVKVIERLYQVVVSLP